MTLLACVFVVFAISNRELTVIHLWPFPFVFELPLYSMVLISIFGGGLWGALIMWFSLGGTRRKARELKVKAEQNARDLGLVRERLEKIENRANDQDGVMGDKLLMPGFLEKK